MVRNRTTSWKVEVDHPNGNTAEPEVIGSPSRNPKINGLPSINIPVRQNRKWDDSVWEKATMRVWFKGERQNIEQLERVEQRQDRTVLVGRGGVELRNIVDDEYESEESTVVADNLITQNTSYSANVDTFQNTVDQNETIDSVSSTSEFQNATTLPSTDPFVINNGRLELAQTNFVTDYAENGQLGSQQISLGEYSGGTGSALGGGTGSAGDSLTFSFTPEYRMNGSDYNINIRYEGVDDTGDGQADDIPAITFYVNGNTVGGITSGASLPQSLSWSNAFTGGLPDLPAGQQATVEIELDNYTGSADDLFAVDVLAVTDNRYSYFFDNDNGGSGGYLDGPELYPDSVQLEFNTVSTARAVTGGRVESTFNNTSNPQQIALSNDDGQNYKTASNQETFETDFASDGSGLRFRATLGRYGSTTVSTPLQGVKGQKIQDYTLKADLTNTPFVINKAFNSSVSEALNFVTDTGDFVWEFQIDNSGTKSVEFTADEQRNVTDDVPIIDYNVKRDSERIIDKVIVFGSSNNVLNEPLTADVGTAVSLNNAWLVEGRERVTDGAGTIYDRGADYDISYNSGTITALSAGAISDGESLEVTYDWRIRKTFDEGASDPLTKVFRFPNVTTSELAQIIAIRLYNELSVEKKTVDVTIPSDVAGFSPINAIDFTEVPVDEIAQIEEVQGTPEKITVRAGTRESLSSLQREIQTQVRSLSDRV